MAAPTIGNFEDQKLWPVKKSETPPIGNSSIFWRFSDIFILNDEPLFTLFFWQHGTSLKYRRVHANYGQILAFLDFSHRRSFAQAEKGEISHAKQLSCYLKALRSYVEFELLTTPEDLVTSKSWRSRVANEWAIRTFRNCGHSKFGRNQYLDICLKDKRAPYGEDPTMFGVCR
jgi:hypothetical protein